MKDYRDVLIRPVVTEQSTAAMEEGKYTFEVPKQTNKIEIRQAVENLFGVKVDKVNIINTSSKPKRYGRFNSTVSGYKKAIVTLKPDYTIDIYGEDE